MTGTIPKRRPCSRRSKALASIRPRYDTRSTLACIAFAPGIMLDEYSNSLMVPPMGSASNGFVIGELVQHISFLQSSCTQVFPGDANQADGGIKRPRHSSRGSHCGEAVSRLSCRSRTEPVPFAPFLVGYNFQ